MKTAVVGLGLIGGSLAKAVKAHTPHAVAGLDRDEQTLAAALDSGAIDASLSETGLWDFDLLLVALYPEATVDFIRQNAAKIPKTALVVDCCGVKGSVCEPCFEIARCHGFTFIGGHPMAGAEQSGFRAARADLFAGASMLLAPPEPAAPQALQTLEDFFLSLGFGRVTYTTPQAHDDIIAYTSQLAHIISSAYIKSPTARQIDGYTAGSFRDMTRVAYLNADMWSELFLDNAPALSREIDGIIGRLQAFDRALRAGDRPTLTRLLEEGKRARAALCERQVETL